MTLQAEPTRSDQWDHPLAIEFALVTGLLLGLYLWQRLVRTVLPDVIGALPIDGFVVNGLLTGGLLVGGLAVFAAVYTSSRGIPVGRIIPTTSDWRLIGVAGLVPVGLAGLTKLVGDLTGIPYNSLTMTAVAANPPAGVRASSATISSACPSRDSQRLRTTSTSWPARTAPRVRSTQPS